MAKTILLQSYPQTLSQTATQIQMLKHTNTNAQIRKYNCSNTQIQILKYTNTNLNEEILAPVSVDDDIRLLRLYHRLTLRLYHITLPLNNTALPSR